MARTGWKGAFDVEDVGDMKDVASTLPWAWALAILLTASSLAFATASSAEDVSGVWQGTLDFQGTQVRRVLTITRSGKDDWVASLRSIDETDLPIPIKSVVLLGSDIRLTIDCNSCFMGSDFQRTYQGTLSKDGMSIVGTWSAPGRAPSPLNFQRATEGTAWPIPGPRTTQFITVEPNVQLEVLDWGGTGRPVILLSGLGSDAHVYFRYVSKLTAKYHVYGITRRGFGRSGRPIPTATNYSADRLGDDVLAVIDALKLERPVLIGHSIAGEELTSIGTRHPEKIAGLVYLDAGYSYAYYDQSHGAEDIDLIALQKRLGQLAADISEQSDRQLIDTLLKTDLPQIERDLRQQQRLLAALPSSPADSGTASMAPAIQAINAEEQKYTAQIHVPILAIFASPHDLSGTYQDDPKAQAAIEAADLASTTEQSNAFEQGQPSARVIRLRHAQHWLFLSNEAEVVHDINSFIDALTPQ